MMKATWRGNGPHLSTFTQNFCSRLSLSLAIHDILTAYCSQGSLSFITQQSRIYQGHILIKLIL